MTCHFSLLPHEALLHISGPDALSFLQGQVTCDTRSVAPGRALPGAYCTPRGRVVCDFLLCQLAADHFALRMRRDIRTDSAAVLARYIIFSKAELDSERDDWQVLACWGEAAAQALGEVFGTVPLEKYGRAAGDGFVLVQMDQAGRQFECLLDTAGYPELLTRMGGAMQSGVAGTWQALQMASGIGRIEAATAGEFIPQMLNYDITGHISFNKGCYTGQEVVARLHYRGKAKRRMYLAEAASSDLPGAGQFTAGTAVYIAGSEQSVGNIVNSAAGDKGVTRMLLTSTEAGLTKGLHAGSPDGPGLMLGALPYEVAGG